MLELTLFLGFPIDTETFDALNPSLKGAYLKEGEAYLSPISHKKTLYLGKWAGSSAELGRLQLLQENIQSLLAKLMPDRPAGQFPLQLIAIQPQESRLCS